MVISCIGHVCTQARYIEGQCDPQQASLTVLENLPIYQELASLNSDIVAGRKQKIKRIWHILRMVSRESPGSIAAWKEAWSRWSQLTQLLNTKRSSDEPDSARSQGEVLGPRSKNGGRRLDRTHHAWLHYAGFLASLGGVCAITDPSYTVLASPSHDSSFATASRPQRTAAASVHLNESPSQLVDQFIREMVQLLSSDNIYLREGAKDILGCELSWALYPPLFRHLEKALSTFDDGPTDGASLVFAEQLIMVLTLLLENLTSSPTTDFTLLGVDFSGLIDQCACFLDKLCGTLNDENMLRTKMRFCHLCEVLMAQKRHLTLRAEFQLRNKLLGVIVGWSSNFATKVCSYLQLLSVTEE